jgi:hypothetical protein
MLKSKSGKPIIISRVLYDPSMTSNLLSIRQLLERGFNMKLHGNMLEVFDSKATLVMKAPLTKNRTFMINLATIETQCFAALVLDREWL